MVTAPTQTGQGKGSVSNVFFLLNQFLRLPTYQSILQCSVTNVPVSTPTQWSK